VRAKDIPEYIRNGFTVTEVMRRVSFNLKDRFVLTGVELIQSFKYLVFIIPVILLLGFFRDKTFSPRFLFDALPFLGALFTGACLVPLLLPWIPGRALSLKGWIAGMVFALIVSFFSGEGIFTWLAYCLLLPPISAFLSLNFTGATTYTSLSGVEKEIRVSMPLIVLSLFAGLICKIAGLFILGGIS
jgi:hypothetical protein